MLENNPGLEQIVYDFLSQKRYTGRESFPKAMSTMVFNPIMSGMKAFGSAAAAMPSDLMDGIGKMGSAASNMLKVYSLNLCDIYIFLFKKTGKSS
jgi:hypothetical protein